MKEKEIKICAESVITTSSFLGMPCINKKRIEKKYRAKALDERIRNTRLKKEAMLLWKTRKLGIRTPLIYFIDLKEKTIVLENIKGLTLKELLEKKPENKKKLEEFGRIIGVLHKNGIIHGDLTTSNVIVSKKNLVLIDFGLGFESLKLEDKAIDLLNLKRTLNAIHSKIKDGFNLIIKGYSMEEPKHIQVLRQLEEAEKRARYK